MPTNDTGNLSEAVRKALLYATALIILLWLSYKIIGVILLLLFALVLVIIINSPVAWLEKKNMKRGWACLIVFGTIALAVFYWPGWVFPRLVINLVRLLPTWRFMQASFQRTLPSGFAII